MKRLNKLLLLSGLLAASVSVGAGTASGSLAVSATFGALGGACTISVPTSLSFGTAIPTPIPAEGVTGNGALQVSCDSTRQFDIGLSYGAGAGATCAARRMTGGIKTLNYALYTPTPDGTGHTNVIWDSFLKDCGGVYSSTTVGATAKMITVHGLIPTGQIPDLGVAYQDTIQATLNF